VYDNMAIEKGAKWIRSPNFRKYFATGFGLSHAGNTIRLDFSDEKVEFSKKDVANVSECQVIMDKKSFNVFFNLLEGYKKEIEKRRVKKKK